VWILVLILRCGLVRGRVRCGVLLDREEGRGGRRGERGEQGGGQLGLRLRVRVQRRRVAERRDAVLARDGHGSGSREGDCRTAGLPAEG
jgi:hypothetical protein